MKVKDLSQPLLSGRMGNLIYYVRNGVQCVRRAEVPGKKRKKERSDQQQTAHTCIAFLPAKTEALIRIVNISGSVPSPLIHSIQHECNEVIRKEKIIRQWIVREDVVFLFTNLAAYKR